MVIDNTTIGKQQAALSAIELIKDVTVLGVGSGSTVNYLIKGLAEHQAQLSLQTIVAASYASKQLLAQYNLPVVSLNEISELPVYIDGADSFNNNLQLLKGGKGAHTCEKILATMSKFFICIVDESKQYNDFYRSAVTLEVLAEARSFVSRTIVKLGGRPELRKQLSEHNNVLLDCYNLSLQHPVKLEHELNSIPGIVGHGLFASRCADKLIIGR